MNQIAEAIVRGYAMMGLSAGDVLHDHEWVWDSRNGSVSGPYKAGDGEKLVAMLNDQLIPDDLKWLNMTAVGPFYLKDIHGNPIETAIEKRFGKAGL